MGFSGGSDSKESACKVDMGLIPGLGRSPGGGHGSPLQCSCLENSHGQRNLVGYSPWGCKELDMTEWLSTHICQNLALNTAGANKCFVFFFFSKWIQRMDESKRSRKKNDRTPIEVRCRWLDYKLLVARKALKPKLLTRSFATQSLDFC